MEGARWGTRSEWQLLLPELSVRVDDLRLSQSEGGGWPWGLNPRGPNRHMPQMVWVL